MDDATIFANTMHSTECKACGGEKLQRLAFCRPCFFRLPKVLRAGLLKHGTGYINHFRVCLNWLRENEGRKTDHASKAAADSF